MVVGLGTGSTAEFAIRELSSRVSDGLKILGVPTSQRTADLARQLQIPLTTLDQHPDLHLTIDGADEVLLPSLQVIKGLGGALLREKIVALASHVEILIVDHTKVVATLGLRTPVPVEVIPFGWHRTLEALAALGCSPTLRHTQQTVQTAEQPYLTDSGNFLLDCKFPSINEGDLPALAAGIKAITGVVEHGLFLNIKTRLIIASPTGIEIVENF
jgi:ribose 5-phosphate isomerase A